LNKNVLPDLLVLDIHAAGFSKCALEILKMLKSQSPPNEFPLILLTGEIALASVLEDIPETGPWAMFVHNHLPVRAALEDAVRDQLEKRRARTHSHRLRSSDSLRQSLPCVKESNSPQQCLHRVVPSESTLRTTVIHIAILLGSEEPVLEESTAELQAFDLYHDLLGGFCSLVAGQGLRSLEEVQQRCLGELPFILSCTGGVSEAICDLDAFNVILPQRFKGKEVGVCLELDGILWSAPQRNLFEPFTLLCEDAALSDIELRSMAVIVAITEPICRMAIEAQLRRLGLPGTGIYEAESVGELVEALRDAQDSGQKMSTLALVESSSWLPQVKSKITQVKPFFIAHLDKVDWHMQGGKQLASERYLRSVLGVCLQWFKRRDNGML
jgi:hypothetical protein